MSTIDRPEPQTLPPLVAGERLDRATFHARYAAMPPETRAELVGGIVYMGSPLGYRHGHADVLLSHWVGHYQLFTEGVDSAGNATTQFDPYGEPQPDLQLRISESCGGQSRIEGGFVVGPPELVVEISASSLRFDLGPKKADYERAGVREYLVVGVDARAVHGFLRHDDHLQAHPPGPDGLHRSEVFPGLWLDPDALFADDRRRLIATLDRGLATPEHAAFVDNLAARWGGA